MPSKQSLAGRQGYLAALFSTSGAFHKLGGRKSSQLYHYTNPETGAVGYEAAVEAGVYVPKGKRHRYSQELLPLNLEIERYENASWRHDLAEMSERKNYDYQ